MFFDEMIIRKNVSVQFQWNKNNIFQKKYTTFDGHIYLQRLQIIWYKLYFDEKDKIVHLEKVNKRINYWRLLMRFYSRTTFYVESRE